MAAYWHIALPIEVRFQDVEELANGFEAKYAADFVFDKVHHYQVQSPELSDGRRLTFDRTEKHYHLDGKLLRSVFPRFYVDFIHCFQEYATEHQYNVYSVARDDDIVSPFLETFTSVAFDDDVDRYLEALDAIEDNYLINHYHLPSSVVYHGYPLAKGYASSMRIISLLHSHEKMQVIPEETVAFHNFVPFMHARFKDRYAIAKYVFVTGY